MRKMFNLETGQVVSVVEHLMMKHTLWEYYITNRNFSDGTAEVLAYGNEIEFAYIDLSTIQDQIAFRNKNLNRLMPIPGWRWVKKRCKQAS